MKENNISKKFLTLGLRNYYSNASLEVTSRCNAACDYCYVADKTTKDLPLEKIYAIMDKLSGAGIIALAITGGEPFVRGDILDIIQYAVKLDFWQISIMTNGALISDEQVNFLINHKAYITSVQFPLFSRHSSVHDKYIGIDGALSHMLAVAQQLKKEGIYIYLAFNTLDCNVNEFSDTYSYFRNLGYDVRIGVTKIKTKENRFNNELEHCTTYDFYKSLLKKAPDKYIECERNRFLKGQKNNTPLTETLVCKGIYKNICIAYSGDIYPCNSFRDLAIGNIFENGSLYDLVNRSEILKQIKSTRRSDIYPCNLCKHSKSCSICLGLIHTETGKINQVSQQICNYAKAVENYL